MKFKKLLVHPDRRIKTIAMGIKNFWTFQATWNATKIWCKM